MVLSYKEIVDKLDIIEKISSKIEKTQILIDIFKKAEEEEVEYLILFISGRVFPEHITKEIGISQNLLIRSISKAYGYETKEIENLWKIKGDIGKVAEEISYKKKQTSLLVSGVTLKEIIETLRTISNLEGEGSIDKKISLVSGLFMKVKGNEAKYIARYILGDMRIGVAEGIIRDAIIGSYFSQFYWLSLFTTQNAGVTEEIMLKYWKNKKFLISKETELGGGIISLIKKIASEVKILPEEEIKKIPSFHYSKIGVDIVITASSELGNTLREKYTKLIDESYALINDYPEVAKIAYKEGEEGLKKIKPIIFRPIRVMLAQRAHSIEESFQIVGKPAAFEYKFDGFRVQIHKKGKKIEIYTRRLENVTKQFPDLVRYVQNNVNAEECIVEGEAIGYDPITEKWLPFQKVSQRIRRKYNVEEMSKKIPVMVHLFDIVYLNGEKLIYEPFKKRREILQSIVNEVPKQIILAKQIITDNEKEAQKFYDEALKKGNEGIMAKNLNAPYEPGLRVGNMIKIKPTLETLDLVIVGAEWGEGKRTGYLSSFELACVDEDTGEFLTIGKLGTGIKEKSESGGVSFEELTDLLKPHIEKEEGRAVKIKPAMVVEVAYEEIQKSPHYTSGYALRFPRLVRIRDDKSPHEADTISRVERIYEMQRGRASGLGM